MSHRDYLWRVAINACALAVFGTLTLVGLLDLSIVNLLTGLAGCAVALVGISDARYTRRTYTDVINQLTLANAELAYAHAELSRVRRLHYGGDQ